MCRRNQIWGIAAAAFGIGLLVGGQISSGFWCGCVGIIIIAVGITFLGKRT